MLLYQNPEQLKKKKTCIWEVELQNIEFAFQGNIVTGIKGQTGQAG